MTMGNLKKPMHKNRGIITKDWQKASLVEEQQLESDSIMRAMRIRPEV